MEDSRLLPDVEKSRPVWRSWSPSSGGASSSAAPAAECPGLLTQEEPITKQLLFVFCFLGGAGGMTNQRFSWPT